ncbi:hypothetical protein [Deminuibacter soli]|uniref:Outer membrane protein beta-barrel domain-containing protein n=1 Tax=Deminuibacter soli TaxID=2291815 RepID=A0A3E1NMC3_9BACT|nr:hypothetical protein [Deminuibacter soli]RFM29073.1 hypothetical protein DXN05_09965 [Deminuibacter soli]
MRQAKKAAGKWYGIHMLAIMLLVIQSVVLHAQTGPPKDSLYNNTPLHPREAPWYVQRFSLGAGFFFPLNNTQVEVSNAAGTRHGTIDFEDDLGFSKNTGTFAANLQWRAARRSRFDLQYFTLNRSSSAILQKEIQFKDHTYPVEAEVGAYFNSDIYRFAWGLAVLSHKNYELGFSLGAHIVKVGVGLGLESNVGSVTYSDNVSFTAPLPDVGIWGGYAFSPRWAVNGEFDYLKLKVGDIDGRLLAGNVSLMFRVVKQLSITAGYSYLHFKVDVNKDKWNGFFKWGYNGPSLAAVFTFGHKNWGE